MIDLAHTVLMYSLAFSSASFGCVALVAGIGMVKDMIIYG